MDLPVSTYAAAVRAARFQDAATDAALHERWRTGKDPLARALLILAAAHRHAAVANHVGAEAKFSRAIGYLRSAPHSPMRDALLSHAETGIEQARSGIGVEPFPADALD